MFKAQPNNPISSNHRVHKVNKGEKTEKNDVGETKVSDVTHTVKG